MEVVTKMIFQKKYKMREEHKRKISEAHKGISFEQKYGKEKAEEIKQRISETCKRKGIKPKEIFYAKREQHPLWKGGLGNIMARKIAQDNGKDLNTCEICKWIEDKNIPVIDKEKKSKSKRMCVHHTDGNRNNNKIQNLNVLCYFCHFAIHDTQNKI